MASYNILIKAAAEARLPEAGEYWYFQARKENLQASLITYTSLISAWPKMTKLVAPFSSFVWNFGRLKNCSTACEYSSSVLAVMTLMFFSS